VQNNFPAKFGSETEKHGEMVKTDLKILPFFFENWSYTLIFLYRISIKEGQDKGHIANE